MDAASLAISIAALYTTCRDCYNFFTTVKTAQESSLVYVRELEIQQAILKAWGFHWQIQDDDIEERELANRLEPKQTKLYKYLSTSRNISKAQGVFSTLSALADTLSDQDKLIKRYGIQLKFNQIRDSGPEPVNNVQQAITGGHFTIEDVQPVVHEVEHRLKMLNKFKWALKDKAGFKELISTLKAHSDSLYRLCPEYAWESLNVYVTLECLARQEFPADLKSTSQLAAELANLDAASSVQDGYKLLASAAKLKASVNEHRNDEIPNDQTLTTIDEEHEQMDYLGKGLALFEGKVVYVEMRDYRGAPEGPSADEKQQKKRRRNRARLLRSLSMNDTALRSYTRADLEQLYNSDSDTEADGDDEQVEEVRPANPQFRALIRNFVSTFGGANMSQSVYGLDIAGMIDHTSGENKGHCSILYSLPGTVGIQSRDRPAENLRLRAPVTLLSLLGKQNEEVRCTLGKRFDLARKLVHAVCMLHSSGWLHKNIRAQSVMFFPEHVGALQEDRYEMKIEIDVSKPILMGYIFSRPDDIGQHGAAVHTANGIGQILPTIRVADENTAFGLPSGLPNPSTTIPQHEDRGYTIPWSTPRQSFQRSTTRYDGIYGRDMPNKYKSSEKSKDITIGGFTLDYYQHPAKHADSKRLYRHAYDVYSLGVLLIEVGLWEKVSGHNYKGKNEEDQFERRRWLCREYLNKVRRACGDIYADVVLSCLMIDTSDDELAKESGRNLCARIVGDLERCQA